jgi:hypothetical protein
MSVKSVVIGIVLVSSAAYALADMADGKGGRTSPQASRVSAGAASRTGCCDTAGSGHCRDLVTAWVRTIDPKVPPQRTADLVTPLRCGHMPPTAVTFEPKVPPQRAASSPSRERGRTSCGCRAS